VTTSYRTDVATADDALLAFIGAMVHPDVDLHIDRIFTPLPCEQCDDPQRLSVVRVYGDPRPECADGPTGPIEACGLCAPALIEQALQDRSDRAGDLVVEVAA
jgi:hypothetical protein